MSRVMVAPGRWLDEGPAHYHAHQSGAYYTRPASNVGQMVPVIVGTLVSTHAEAVRRRRREAKRARHGG